MSYDPKVWTSDPAMPKEGFYWRVLWYDGPHYAIECVESGDNEPLGDMEARSILPIPSAEEIAALVELERAVLAQIDTHDESSVTDEVFAALARLDAVRKERGA